MASEITSSPQTVSKSARQAAKVKGYVNHQLEKTRKQVKSVDLIAGGLVLVAFVVGVLMLAVLIDGWIWPLPGWARWACLMFLVAGCVAYTVSSIVPLLLKRINPDYAAKMIEEAKPSFQNSLLNYVSLRKKPEAIKPAVFDAVSRQAAANLATVPEDATVDRSKLIRLGFVLIGLTVFAVGYKMISPKDPLQTIARIVFPAGKIAKPAVVNISDVEPGDARVFFGEQLNVTATVRGRHDPEDVRLIYSTLDGQRIDQTIQMMPESASNRYSASLSMGGGGIQQSLRYQVVARDGASPDYEVTVQPNPAITIESLVLQPPAYTKMRKRTLAGQGDIDAIEGTKVSVHAIANLPIKLAYIELLNEVRDPNQPLGEIDYESRYRVAATPIQMESEGTSADGNFLITLNTSGDKPIATHYRIRFVSTDDNRNRQPNVYPIRIIPDLAPEIRVRNPVARDIEIPVNASFPILMEANDLDFEIKSVSLDIEHDGSKLVEQNLELTPVDGNRRVTAGYRLCPADLGLKVGDTAIFFGTAADNQISPYSEQPDPNVSRTENYTFKVTARDESATEDPNTKNGSGQTGEKDGDETEDGGDNGNDNSEKGTEESDPNETGNDDATDENGSKEKGNPSDDSGDPGEEEGGSNDETGKTNSGQNDPGEGEKNDPQTGENGNSDSPENSENGDDPESGGTGSEQSAQPPEQPEGGGEGSESSGKGESSETDSEASGNNDGTGSDSGDDSTSNEGGGGSSPTDPSDGDPQGQPGSEGGQNSEGDGRKDDSLTSGAQETVSDNASESELIRKMQEHFENQQEDKSEENNPNENSDPQDGTDPEGTSKQEDQEQSGKGTSDNEPSDSDPSTDPKNSQNTDSDGNETGKGESGSEESGKGESGSEESGKGESGSEESGKGESGSEESGKGESGSEESGKGESGSEESGKGESGSEESGKGESGSEESGKGESGSEESGKGESGSEESGKGESGSEESGKGESGSEESGKGESGSEESGKGESGSEESGKGESGSEESGKGESGSEESGKGESGKGESGKGETGSGETDEGEKTGNDPGSNKSQSSGESSQSGQPGDKPSVGEKTPGSEGEKGGNQPGSASSSETPGAGAGDQLNSPNSKVPGGTGKGVGSAEGERRKKEEANLDHAKKATDMILNRLAEQKNDPDPELLRKLKMSKEELEEFRNRWDEMKRKAESGNAAAKRKYSQALKSLGLKPEAGSSEVNQNQDNVEGLNEDGAINEPPPELVPDFNSFIRDLSRVRDD